MYDVNVDATYMYPFHAKDTALALVLPPPPPSQNVAGILGSRWVDIPAQWEAELDVVCKNYGGCTAQSCNNAA